MYAGTRAVALGQSGHLYGNSTLGKMSRVLGKVN